MTSRSLQEVIISRQGDASINAFADQIGLPVATLHSLLTGSRNAGVETLRRLARAFPNDNPMRQAIIEYIFGEEMPVAV